MLSSLSHSDIVRHLPGIRQVIIAKEVLTLLAHAASWMRNRAVALLASPKAGQDSALDEARLCSEVAEMLIVLPDSLETLSRNDASGRFLGYPKYLASIAPEITTLMRTDDGSREWLSGLIRIHAVLKGLSALEGVKEPAQTKASVDSAITAFEVSREIERMSGELFEAVCVDPQGASKIARRMHIDLKRRGIAIEESTLCTAIIQGLLERKAATASGDEMLPRGEAAMIMNGPFDPTVMLAQLQGPMERLRNGEQAAIDQFFAEARSRGAPDAEIHEALAIVQTENLVTLVHSAARPDHTQGPPMQRVDDRPYDGPHLPPLRSGPPNQTDRDLIWMFCIMGFLFFALFLLAMYLARKRKYG